MKLRLFSVFAVAAIGLTCAGSAMAGTSVQLSYVAPAIVYAPPPPVYYYVAPPPPPPRYYAPTRTVIVAPPPHVIYGAPVVILR